jgi:hypothetical protein
MFMHFSAIFRDVRLYTSISNCCENVEITIFKKCIVLVLISVKYLEIQGNMESYKMSKPMPVAARSKVWVCCRSLAGIPSSKPARGMDACVVRVLCVVR